MQVLKLCESNNITQLPNLGKELGYGADGQVFEIVNDPYRVIKLSVCFDMDKSYSKLESALQYLIQYKPASYAVLYESKYLGNFTRHFIDENKASSQDYFLYFYVLEKLFKITEDEKKVFHSILSHEDGNIVKNYPVSKVKEMLKGLGYGLDFDYDKVILFYQNLISVPIKHLDLHARNIMKDSSGNFKMIDFDRVKLEN